MPQAADTQRRIVFWIAVGIIVWGVILAIGVFLENHHDPRAPLVIVAGVVLFVGFWLTMLRSRRSNERSEPPE
jgi:O-antigen/teichoic acid export membrane protein